MLRGAAASKKWAKRRACPRRPEPLHLLGLLASSCPRGAWARGGGGWRPRRAAV